MKVCYFGIYDDKYCRNKNIIIGLEDNDVEVIKIEDRTPGIRKFWNLYKKFKDIKNDFDLMIVGFPGQIIVPFAKIICRNKPIVFDLHVSYYDSIILERKEHNIFSVYSFWYYFLDWISCKMADLILMDTNEHIKYVSELLHIDRNKFLTVYHGIDDRLFDIRKVKLKLAEENSKDFIISFHGYIQPLNGMEWVIEAMNKLKDENIKLWVIGGGVDYEKVRNLSENILKLKKVEFYPPMKPEQLVEKISNADIGLGFFSKSKKIDRVIANKVYELMALKIPVLTGSSIASGEHFKQGEHIYYCKRGSINAIANSIITLKNDSVLRKKISENAYRYVKDNLNPKKLGETLKPVFVNCIRLFNSIKL